MPLIKRRGYAKATVYCRLSGPPWRISWFLRGQTRARRIETLKLTQLDRVPAQGAAKTVAELYSPLIFWFSQEEEMSGLLSHSTVRFDIDADGFAELIEWPSADAGLLVLDRDNDQQFNDGECTDRGDLA